MRNPLSKTITTIQPSGIRKFFDIVSEMKDAISLGVGEPDFDTPWHIRDEGIYSLEKGKTFYTSNAGLKELKEEIAKFLDRRYDLHYDPMAEIFITVGGSEAIDVAMRAMLDPGDEVLIPQPSYVSYVPCCILANGTPVPIELQAKDQFRLTPELLEAAITPKTKLLVMPFPNNPTGAVMEKADLEKIAELVIKYDLFVLSDEIYSELTYLDRHVSIASLPGMKERTIVINGFSKSHAMTGWRIGYTAAPLAVSKLMASLQSHMASNPNSIAQAATVAALNGSQDCVTEMCVEFKKRRDYIFEREEAIPMLSALKPQGAFYLFVDVSATYGKSYEGEMIQSAADFASVLLDKKYVAVVPCADFGMPDYIRLSYATSMEIIKEGMDRIEAMVKELK